MMNISMFNQRYSPGFALPTTIITASVMMVVVLTALVGVTSIATSLKSLIYQRTAKQAAESGIVAMRQCINSGQVRASGDGVLRPNTTACKGSATSGTLSAYLDNTSTTYRTTYEVTPPIISGGYYDFTSTGKVERLRGTTVIETVERQLRLHMPSPQILASQASIGALTACGIINSRVQCWGENLSGQMGNGTISTGQYVADGSGNPIPVRPLRTNLLKAEIMISGGSDLNCALTTNDRSQTDITSNKVACWGVVRFMGNSTLNNNASTCSPKASDNTCAVPTPTEISTPWSGKYPVRLVSIPGASCVLVKATAAATSSETWCWGNDEYSQLANDGYSGRTDASGGSIGPVPVLQSAGGARFTTFKDIYATPAMRGFCGRDFSDVLYCWGDNSNRQTGTGTNNAITYYPTKVQLNGGGDFVAANAVSGNFSTGTDSGHTCAIRSTNQKLYCWGSANSGKLGHSGTATTTLVNTATIVPSFGGTTNYTALSVSTTVQATCAVVNLNTGGANRVYCFGGEIAGELGNGSPNNDDNVTTPVLLSFPSGAGEPTLLSGGFYRHCAVVNTDLYCWGTNGVGQVGNGQAGNQILSPVKSLFYAPSEQGILY